MTLVAPSMSGLHHSSSYSPAHPTSAHNRYAPTPAAQSAPAAYSPMNIKMAPPGPAIHHQTYTAPPPSVSGRTPSPITPPPSCVERYSGVVKTFYPERGYGWMSCSRAGRDVFVHANDLQSPEARNLLPFLPGTVLEFDIAQRPRGLSAINVAVLSIPQPAASVDNQLEARGRRRVIGESFVPSRPIAMGRRFQGTVVYYTSSKGYGFVQTNNLAGKVYVHLYAVEKFNVTELRIGMVLEFSVRENHKGKYACNVKLLRDVPSPDVDPSLAVVAVTMWEGRYRGILKSFDTKRSLGWIQYRNTEVFMHIYEIRQDNAEARLHLGVELEFSIGTHGRGPTAYDIDIIGTPAAATLRSIPMSQLSQIPVFGSVDSDINGNAENEAYDEYSTQDTYGSASEYHTQPTYNELLRRLGVSEAPTGASHNAAPTAAERPTVSLSTVALLASLLEAAGVDTVADDAEVSKFQNQATEEETLAKVLRHIAARAGPRV